MKNYRVVEIVNAPSVRDYTPYGGQQWFRDTKQVGTSLVGEYDVLGPADAVLLPPYLGEWPIPVAGSYKTTITGQQFMDLIDEQNMEIWAEIEDFANGGNQNAKDFVGLVTRRLSSPIDITKTRIDTVLNALEAQTSATAQDVITIKQGVLV